MSKSKYSRALESRPGQTVTGLYVGAGVALTGLFQTLANGDVATGAASLTIGGLIIAAPVMQTSSDDKNNPAPTIEAPEV